jgi:hypothetical protein
MTVAKRPACADRLAPPSQACGRRTSAPPTPSTAARGSGQFRDNLSQGTTRLRCRTYVGTWFHWSSSFPRSSCRSIPASFSPDAARCVSCYDSNEAARLVINPVQSARLRSTGTFSFTYGRMEVSTRAEAGV